MSEERLMVHKIISVHLLSSFERSSLRQGEFDDEGGASADFGDAQRREDHC